jgi:extradiol dioxygenase family protein
MSIAVELEHLRDAIDATDRAPYLLTVGDDGRPHSVAATCEWRDGELALSVGNRSLANARVRTAVALLWAPSDPGGYSLIVDAVVTSATGSAGGDNAVRVRPASAVLHRPAAQPTSPPILHLSLPVRDLDEARAFYVDALGCRIGRVRDGFIDVWFYGMQLTLHERPDQLLGDDQRGVRHYGVTLPADRLTELLVSLAQRDVDWLSTVTTEHAGTPREQTKAKVLDPSGNAIELKAYKDPAAALAD